MQISGKLDLIRESKGPKTSQIKRWDKFDLINQKQVTDLLAFCQASQKSMNVVYGFRKRFDAQHCLLVLVEK